VGTRAIDVMIAPLLRSSQMMIGNLPLRSYDER
jgi:hypothetical protein